MKFRHRQMVRYLMNSDPGIFLKLSDKLLLKSFRKASDSFAGYARFLRSKKINFNEINTIDRFKKNVPVVTKNDFFVHFSAPEWFRNGNLKGLKTVMSSSGFSGTFAFGAELNTSNKRTKKGIDFVLDMLFDTGHKKTLLINCVPMGVHIETSLPVAETSVRSEMAIAIAQKISPHFQQTIIIGDPHFLKKLIEEGLEKNMDWGKINTSLICGQDYFPESYRTYMAKLIGLDVYNDPDRLIMATMGTTELGLNIFHESYYTIKIRAEIQKNKDLSPVLPGFFTKAVPFLFHYYPLRHYIEDVNDSDGQKALLFSVLNKDAPIPLFRYHTGDAGNLLSYEDLLTSLKEHNLSGLIPELKLPLVSFQGRLNNYCLYRDCKIHPSDIKLGLYEDHGVAAQTTGYFKIKKSDEIPEIEIQLKPEIKKSNSITSSFSSALLKYLPVELPVKVYEYKDFPYGMNLDYESKFINL